MLQIRKLLNCKYYFFILFVILLSKQVYSQGYKNDLDYELKFYINGKATNVVRYPDFLTLDTANFECFIERKDNPQIRYKVVKFEVSYSTRPGYEKVFTRPLNKKELFIAMRGPIYYSSRLWFEGVFFLNSKNIEVHSSGRWDCGFKIF